MYDKFREEWSYTRAPKPITRAVLLHFVEFLRSFKKELETERREVAVHIRGDEFGSKLRPEQVESFLEGQDFERIRSVRAVLSLCNSTGGVCKAAVTIDGSCSQCFVKDNKTGWGAAVARDLWSHIRQERIFAGTFLGHMRLVMEKLAYLFLIIAAVYFTHWSLSGQHSYLIGFSLFGVAGGLFVGWDIYSTFHAPAPFQAVTADRSARRGSWHRVKEEARFVVEIIGALVALGGLLDIIFRLLQQPGNAP